jgi:GT2 family glycosyltransferase
MHFNVSVIITTYNRPKALAITLQSLSNQNILPNEVIIADDGSTLSPPIPDSLFPIKHIWHEDTGFRAATIRNKATALSTSEYLIFLDGDIAVFPDFIEQHKKLAEEKWFVSGNRILINQKTTAEWENSQINPLAWSKLDWLKAKKEKKINRLSPLIRASLPSYWRKHKANQWQGAKTCNLGIWKQDFLAVNGFDETYQGWGHEDADLAIRLIHQGIQHKDGRFAIPALHLWHPENSRHNEGKNWRRLQNRIADPSVIIAEQGVDQYL